MSDIYREISKLLSEGRRGALATVIGASGSTPGKESAKMLIREDGTIFGTIGGGCTEADVWALAREAIERELAAKLESAAAAKGQIETDHAAERERAAQLEQQILALEDGGTAGTARNPPLAKATRRRAGCCSTVDPPTS